MVSRPAHHWLAALLVSFITAVGAAPSLAEPELSVAKPEPEWDADRVIDLATELVEAVGAALLVAREAPGQETALQQRKRDAAVGEMQRVHGISREYLARLRERWSREGPEDSAYFFQQLRRSVEGARETAADAVPTARGGAALERVSELLDELARFYPAN
jgi:hypothetical protein